MRKYLSVFSASWQSIFIYRLNFILWRVRNILYLLMVYFLWSGVFLNKGSIAGYSRDQMLTYILLLLFMRSIVLSSESSDSVGGEIASGDLSNYLLKPFSYFRYWFTRDVQNKLFNLIFAVFEISLLWILLKPVFVFPPNTITVLAFILICVAAACLFFFVSMTFKFIAFWAPENTWGLTFLMLVFIETLGGALFPLDLLPYSVRYLISFTPFPYLIYYPVAVYLGKFSGIGLLQLFFQYLAMCGLWFMVMITVWKNGLRVFSAEGR